MKSQLSKNIEKVNNVLTSAPGKVLLVAAVGLVVHKLGYSKGYRRGMVDMAKQLNNEVREDINATRK